MQPAKRKNQIVTSEAISITNQVVELKRQGMDIISLGAGEPDFQTPQHIKVAAIEAINKGYTRYTHASGIAELKEAVANKLKQDNHIEVEPSDVIISCGGKFALAAAILALCDQQDEVLIPVPYWGSFPQMVRLAGAKPVFVPTKPHENFAIDMDALQQAATSKTKMILFNNPVNPSGAVYDNHVTNNLAGWLKSTNIIALTDEIYDAYIYDNVKIRSLASYPEIQDRVITVNGVSKTYAMTGWRIGYAAGPQKYISQIATIQSHMTTHPSSISQWAALAAISGDQSFINDWVARLKKRKEWVEKKLLEIRGIKCPPCQGTFYLFPDISYFLGRKKGNTEISNSMDLCQYLLTTEKVALFPGVIFGSPNHLRISFATSMNNLKQAMNRIQNGLQNLD